MPRSRGWYAILADKDYKGKRYVVAITQSPDSTVASVRRSYDFWIGKGNVEALGPYDTAADASEAGEAVAGRTKSRESPYDVNPRASSRMMNRSGKFKKPFHLTKWEERDRVHIALVDDDGQTIVEWWDDEAREAFEDGFLDRRRLQASAEEYAKHMGII